VDQPVSYHKTLGFGKDYEVTISYEREIDYKESAFKEFLIDYFYHEIILNFFPSYKRLGRK